MFKSSHAGSTPFETYPDAFPLISGAGGPGFSDFFEQLGRTIAYHPEAARMLGNIKAALFLQQLMWWTPKGKDPDGWVYKSVLEWEEETTLTYKEQLGVRALLGKKKLGVVEERYARLEHRPYFRVNRETLNDLWNEWIQGAHDKREDGHLGEGKMANSGKLSSVVPVDDLQEKTAGDSSYRHSGGARAMDVSKPTMKVSKKHSEKHSAAKEKKHTSQAAPRGRTGEAPHVPPPAAAAPTDPYRVAGFDHLWAAIPKRISTGSAKVEAFEVWKTLRPVPTRRHVSEMVRLLTAYLEEETDYAFYEFDGTVKVTPARLIGLLVKAMNDGSPLRKVVDEEIPL